MSSSSRGPEARPRARRRRRVAVVLQQEPTECGAACLAMVLRFHGRMTSLTECRAACGAGRDGANARAIVHGARGAGLVARGFQGSAADLSSISLPAIVHWRAEHFVVVERVGPRRVDIVDPAEGRRRISPESLAANFSGVVLTFEPGEAFERRGAASMFTWRTYLRGLWEASGVRGALAQVLVASLVLQGLGLLLPLFTKVVIDQLLPGRLAGLLPILGVGMGLWIGAQGLLGYLRALVLLHVRMRLDATVMTSFFTHLLSLPFRYFQTRTSGDLLTRLSSNSVLRELFTAQTVSVGLDAILVLSYLGLLLAWAPSFGLIALGLGAVEALIVGATTPRMTRLAQHDLRAQADTQSYLVEVLGGIATLKAAGAEHRALDHWTERFWIQLRTSLARGHFSIVIQTLVGVLRAGAPLLLLLVGTRAVLAGDMSLGTMLAVNALAAAFLAPVSSLLTSVQSLQIVGAHLERIADVLQAEPEPAPEGGVALASARVPIALREVAFRYAPDALDVLRDITFTIEPGAKVAIVGPTGSGKSTLGLLLLGLHAPTAGTITIDGHPRERVDLRTLRGRFGVVLQDSALFAGTLRENIAFHDPALPEADVVAAAELACIHQDIAAMPMGYGSMLAEGGAGLSGGQKQRLSLARALARRPDLLLLDEATSHLDPATERAVERNLARLGCTRVIISHRPSAVRDADCIVVLRAGRIVMQGTHEELRGRGGPYDEFLGTKAESER